MAGKFLLISSGGNQAGLADLKPAVATAVYLAKSMDVETIKWVVFVVALHTALGLLVPALRPKTPRTAEG